MGLDRFFREGGVALDYDALYDAFVWVRDMAATPQDPRYHAEGDVWTHTRLVCDALSADAEWPALDTATRRLLLTAALLHDAGKPEVTFTDPDGRIRSPEHAVRGERIARRVLWELEEPFAFREHVAMLVRHHMQPRYLPLQRDPRRRLFAISYVVRCDLLAMLARADTRGRIAPDYDEGLDAIARFTRSAERHGCLSEPRRFATDHARFLWFRHRLADPDDVPPEPSGPTVTVLSGLPASGKDTWLAARAVSGSVISLDAIRAEIDVPPSAPQDAVVALAHDRARACLAAGQDFVWNATTLGRRHRRTLLDLVTPYDPRVHIVHLDAPPSLVFPRNRARAPHAVVPDDVIWRMTGIWQPPDLTEAHALHVVEHTATSAPRS